MKLASLVGLVAMLSLGSLALRQSAVGETLGDVLYSRAGTDAGIEQYPPAYFPHWVHRIRYKCYACHDGLFPMRRGPNPTMAAMANGESCGACHNGKVAFDADTCQRCHVE
jgi:c(7)-type cytochrome triheme protein